MRHPRSLACLLTLAAPVLAWADNPGPLPASDPSAVDGITVTATRLPRSTFETPASIDSVSATDLHDNKVGVNLAEQLKAVPGLLLRDRADYAQEEQLSIRGFGARAQFGIVGVRLFVDGIPATQPDGQGQSSHFNLDSAQRIEVLRGPFSALYGNASGGVVQLFTADGSLPDTYSFENVGGSYATWRSSANARGVLGPMAYNLDFTHFQTDGYRDHSQARRESGNGKLSFHPLSGNTLSLLGNSVSIPEAQDELGLTHDQFKQNPQQAQATALTYNTRKSVEQLQGGFVDEQKFGDDQSIRVLGYYGNRIVKQFQAIPTGAESNPLSPGGVIDLHNAYTGGDARWSGKFHPWGQPLTLVAGLSYDHLDELRKGYNNFVGSDLGVQGDLRRDETDTLYNFDQYLQADWDFANRWAALAGVRHSQVRFKSADHYVTATNPDDSGETAYYATTPVAGLLFRPTDNLRLHASFGQGFDTPTLDNLAYRPDGETGLNFGLQPDRTNDFELGARWKIAAGSSADAAVFRTLTREELVVATSGGGRSTYQNAGRTRRQGVELHWTTQIAMRWQWDFAYTYLDAIYREAYQTCTSKSCVVPSTTIPAGNRLTGVPENLFSSSLRWGADRGWNAAVEVSYLSDIQVSDVNRGAAPAYGLLGSNVGYVWARGRWKLRSFVRVDNLLDTRYIGAIVVNDSNSQYYEPGLGRSVYGGVAASFF